jgi:hypothetical protein
VRQFAAFASNARADEIPLSRRPSCRIADVRFLVFTNTAVSPGNSVSMSATRSRSVGPESATTGGHWSVDDLDD